MKRELQYIRRRDFLASVTAASVPCFIPAGVLAAAGKPGAGKRPCMDIEIGHRVATMNNLGNLSYLLGRKLYWDGAKEQFIDDEQANKMLSRPHREPYLL